MSNFLNIPALPGVSSGPLASPVGFATEQWNKLVNANSWNEYTSNMSPMTKKIILISVIIFFVIFFIAHQIYRYLRRIWDIRDTLYVFETFTASNDRRIQLYYGSPLKMERMSVPGGEPGSFWYRTDTKIRIITTPFVDIQDGATIRLWLRLSAQNFTENVGVDKPRAIFTQGLVGSQGTVAELIANPMRLMGNQTWINQCQLGLFLDRRVNQLIFRVGKSTGGDSFAGRVDDVPVKRWFQLTLRVSRGVCEVYMDGELLHVWSIPQGFRIPSGSSMALFHQLPTVGFWGWISFMQVFTGTMTPMEIQKKYLLERPDIDKWEFEHQGIPDTQPTIKKVCASGDANCRTD